MILTFIPLMSQTKKKVDKTEMKVTSSAFNNGEMIPAKYTFDGLNVSPPLSWSNAPAGAKSFALINDDPDAPIGDWVHWIVYNIPPDITGFKENMPNDKSFRDGMMHGTNDFKQPGYLGPSPPSGTHRYYFKIYALDTMLKIAPGATKKELLAAIEKHILAEGCLTGKYKRK